MLAQWQGWRSLSVNLSECQGKLGWVLDMWIFCPEGVLLGSDGCRICWQLSWVLTDCAGVYTPAPGDGVLSVSHLRGAEFSFKLFYLTGNSAFLLHSRVSNEVQIRCNLQFYKGYVIFSVSVSSSEMELSLMIITSHSETCINVCFLTRSKPLSTRHIHKFMHTWVPGMGWPHFGSCDLASWDSLEHKCTLHFLPNNQQLGYNRLWWTWGTCGNASWRA
jgi:hypothetical protein